MLISTFTILLKANYLNMIYHKLTRNNNEQLYFYLITSQRYCNKCFRPNVS